MAETLPVVNGSTGTWGTILNTAIGNIDTRLETATAANSTQDGAITALQADVAALEAGGGKFIVATSSTRPTAAVGQIVLETDTGYLYYVADVASVATAVPFPGSYVAKLKRTTTQNFGNNSAGEISWGAADTDRLAGWTIASPTRYTATVPGAYEFTGAISWATNATGYRSVTWHLNGSVTNCASAIVAGTSGEATVVVARPVVLKLAVGDYVELRGLQNSGVTLATDVSTANQPSMQARYLGYNV